MPRVHARHSFLCLVGSIGGPEAHRKVLRQRRLILPFKEAQLALSFVLLTRSHSLLSMSLDLNRREFIQAATSFAALSAIGIRERSLSIVAPQDDPTANQPAARWAISELQHSLAGRGVGAEIKADISRIKRGDFCILVAGAKSPLAAQVLGKRVAISEVAEALAIASGTIDERRVLLASGSD